MDTEKPIALAGQTFGSDGRLVESEDQVVFDVAARLIAESKPLDRDFLEVLDREFWSLL